MTLRAAGIDLALAEVRRSVLETARRSGLLDTLGDDRVFRTVDEALQAISRAP
jgi:STAS domain